jgi:DNA-binding NarL/FixJ family response regulator
VFDQEEHRRMPTNRTADYGPRLAAAGQDVLDKTEAAKAARELRNTLIVEAVDQGMTTYDVARHTGLSQSTVMQVLGRPEWSAA